MDRQIGEWLYYLFLQLEVFIQRNFVADFIRHNLNFTHKMAKIAFSATLWCFRGNVCTSMVRWKKKGGKTKEGKKRGWTPQLLRRGWCTSVVHNFTFTPWHHLQLHKVSAVFNDTTVIAYLLHFIYLLHKQFVPSRSSYSLSLQQIAHEMRRRKDLCNFDHRSCSPYSECCSRSQ